MKRWFRMAALLLSLVLVLTSCSLFAKIEETDRQENEPFRPSVDTETEQGEESAKKHPGPEQLLAALPSYSVSDTTLLLAASEDCKLFLENSDSLAVSNTLLSAVEGRYGITVALGQYTANQMLYGVTDMVEKGSGTHYFADLLILSATEFVRYRDAGLLDRIEILPFVDVDADCFDAELTALFLDDGGTYGLVGAGSHAFKARVTLFFNPELLAAEGIAFDGYSMMENGSFDLSALAAVLAEYREKTGEAALVSGLSREATEGLLGEDGNDLLVEAFGENGDLAFMMGKVPFYIGTLGQVEKMPAARDKYGMLPIPVVENGQYATLYDPDSLYVFCIPKGNARTDCTGAFLQAWHTAATYLPYDYFENQLIEKYVWDEGTLKSIFLVAKKEKEA